MQQVLAFRTEGPNRERLEPTSLKNAAANPAAPAPGDITMNEALYEPTHRTASYAGLLPMFRPAGVENS